MQLWNPCLLCNTCFWICYTTSMALLKGKAFKSQSPVKKKLVCEKLLFYLFKSKKKKKWLQKLVLFKGENQISWGSGSYIKRIKACALLKSQAYFVSKYTVLLSLRSSGVFQVQIKLFGLTVWKSYSKWKENVSIQSSCSVFLSF